MPSKDHMRSGARADQSLSRRPRSSRATPRQRAAAARSRIRCAVDARALREYVQGTGHAADAVPRHKDGTSYGATRRELARRLLTRVCAPAFAGWHLSSALVAT